MKKLVFDGKYEAWLVETVADIDAPTVTEITAGDRITLFAPKDFLQWGKNQARVSGGDISTLYEAEEPGTWTIATTVQLFRDEDGTDPVADGTIALGTVKYLVILPSGASGANGEPTDGDLAYVARFKFGQPTPANTAENQNQRWEVDLFGQTPQPSFTATVTSGA